jgi:hypothetical protein
MHLWLTLEPEEPAQLYGAFKGNTRAAFGALLRVLRQPVSLTRPPRSFELPRHDGIREFFAGTSDYLLSEARPMDESLFAQTLFAHDKELLARFYEIGPRRTRRLCEKHGLTRIPQERLDDLIALG